MLCNFRRIRVLGFLPVVALMWCEGRVHEQEQPGAPRVITATKHDIAQQPLRALQQTVSLAAGFVNTISHQQSTWFLG